MPLELSKVRSTRSERKFRTLTRRFQSRKTVVAEGDSWFAYPPKFLIAGPPSNVIDHVKNMRRYNLLQLAVSGDESVDMLTGSSKFKLVGILEKYHVDTLLFSGGGNDVVGAKDFDFFLRRGVTSSSWRDYVHMDRLERRLDMVGDSYRDLIDYCRSYSKNPNLKVVTHTYDYARPDPQGARFLGGIIDGKSWVYPYLREARVPEAFDQRVVNHLIDALADQLLDLESRFPDILRVSDTRGTLAPGRNKLWINEIHPSEKGFKKIARKVFDRMNAP
jgi:hypothetical protein